jgi:hypothetical protein
MQEADAEVDMEMVEAIAGTVAKGAAGAEAGAVALLEAKAEAAE